MFWRGKSGGIVLKLLNYEVLEQRRKDFRSNRFQVIYVLLRLILTKIVNQEVNLTKGGLQALCSREKNYKE